MSASVARKARANHSPPPPLLGIHEMSALLGIHHLTLRRLIKRGEVPYFVVGNMYRFDAAAVLAALEGGR